MPRKVDIVCDVGGTNMRVAAVCNDFVEVPLWIPTPQDPAIGIEKLIELAHTVAPDAEIESMVVGFPGLLNEQGELYDTTNLPQWGGIKLAKELEAVFDVLVIVENDALLAGLGEACVGAGRYHAVVGYVTVSTGVGGGRIVDGFINSTHPYIIGHQRIAGGELEDMISGTAVRKIFGREPYELTFEQREALADLLAVGLCSAHKQWRPDVFVLGGPMMTGKNPIPINRVRRKFMEYVPRAAPPVWLAELGDMSGLHGAHILAQQMRRGCDV